MLPLDEATTRIKQFLADHSMDLLETDVIAGGFVRDTLFDIPINDVDLYSAGRVPNILLNDYRARARALVGITNMDQFDGVAYEFNGVKIDHKFIDQTLCTPEKITGMFMMSICQCAYSSARGIYMSPDFQRTIFQKKIFVDPGVRNWNLDQDRYSRHHYEKIKARFPDFEIEPLPAMSQRPSHEEIRSHAGSGPS